jgi:hypothetical protein
MGQLQINNLVNLLGSLDSNEFNDESSFEENIIEYEGRQRMTHKKSCRT